MLRAGIAIRGHERKAQIVLSKKEAVLRSAEIQHQAKRIRMAQGAAGLDNKAFAEALSAELGYSFNRNRVANVRDGADTVDKMEVYAIARVTGESVEFVSGDPVILDGPSVIDLSEDKGAYLPTDRDIRDYLTSTRDIDSYLTPDDHWINAGVSDHRWHERDETPPSKIEGQTEIVVEIDHLRVAS